MQRVKSRGKPVSLIFPSDAMDSFTLILSLLLALSAGCSARDERCSAHSDPDINLSVTSHRNETGHWTLSMDALTAKPEADSSQSGVAVDISLGSASCGSAQYTRLSAIAVYEPHQQDGGTTTQIPITVSEIKTHAASSTAATPAPPAGYEFRGGLGHYKFHVSGFTWEEARDRCVSEGGHLLVINSVQEAAVVTQMWTENRGNISGAKFDDEVYVGVSDIAQEGRWETVLGGLLEDTGYVRWQSGDPNGSTEANCLSVDVDNGVLLRDYPCTLRFAFMCEWHPQQ